MALPAFRLKDTPVAMTAPAVTQAPVAATTVGKYTFAQAMRTCVIANATGDTVYWRVNDLTTATDETSFDGIVADGAVANIAAVSGTTILTVQVWIPGTVTGMMITGQPII